MRNWDLVLAIIDSKVPEMINEGRLLNVEYEGMSKTEKGLCFRFALGKKLKFNFSFNFLEGKLIIGIKIFIKRNKEWVKLNGKQQKEVCDESASQIILLLNRMLIHKDKLLESYGVNEGEYKTMWLNPETRDFIEKNYSSFLLLKKPITEVLH